MATVLVTGAGGFAAGYVADALRSRGHRVVGLAHAKLTIPLGGAFAATEAADLRVLADVRRAIRVLLPDAVVHLAAISHVAFGNASEIYETNVIGTHNLMQALAEVGPISGPTAIVSSANVYGNRQGGALHEALTPRPQSDYAISKLAGEFIGDVFSARVRNFIVRPFNYTGVGQSRSFLIPKIVYHVQQQAQRIELGNMNIARDFSDVRFFADVLAKLMDLDLDGARVNICSGFAYSLSAVLDLVARLSGTHLKVETNPALVRENEVERLWGDNTKLQSLLGPIEGPSLEETLRWMLDNPIS